MPSTFDRNRPFVFPRPVDAGNHIVLGKTGFHRGGFRFQAAVEQSAGLAVAIATGQKERRFRRHGLSLGKRHQQRDTAELKESTARWQMGVDEVIHGTKLAKRLKQG